jgi:hypothetical protein
LKRAIIVAHPDDESLWCGGLPFRYPGDWTVICCSIPERDPERAYKFFRACEVMGVKARLNPVPESRFNLDWLDPSEFEHIVTHNENGEYGHAHHQHVHKWVRQKFSGPITTIGYNGPVNQKLELTKDELNGKLRALMSYDHCLPYEGRNLPKWKALLHRYGTIGGLDIANETYGGAPL